MRRGLLYPPPAFLWVGPLLLGLWIGNAAIGAEPTFEGLAARDWALLLKDKEPDHRREVAKRLWVIGKESPTAVEALLPCLKDDDGEVRALAAEALWDIARDQRASDVLLDMTKDKEFRGLALRALSRNGQTASVIAMLNDAATRRSAIFALAHAGAKGVPPVLDVLLKEEDDDEREEFAKTLARIGPDAVPALVKTLQSADPKLRKVAANALGVFKEHGKEATEALLTASGDPDIPVKVRAWFAFKWSRASADALPVILRATKHANPETRRVAVELLGHIAASQEETKVVIDALIQSLTDTDFNVRSRAARSLGSRGAEAKAARDALVERLRDPYVQVAAARVLWKLEQHRDALGVFIENVYDPGIPFARGEPSVLEILRDAGSAAKPAVPTLLKCLNERLHREEVAEALWHIDHHGPALRILRQSVEQEDGFSRFAVEALGRIGPPAKDAVPEICRAFNAGDSTLCRSATVALLRIGPDAKAALPSMIQCLQDKKQHGDARKEAVRILGSIGPGAEKALDVLNDALKDEDREIRARAAEAKWRISRDAQAIPLLIESLAEQGEFWSTRWGRRFSLGESEGAVSALYRIGADAVPALVVALDDRHATRRANAAATLGLLSSKNSVSKNVAVGKNSSVQTKLIALLDDEVAVAIAAGQALGQIGPVVVPKLRPLLNHKSARVRAGAAVALAKIGGDANEAVPELASALQDTDYAVRAAAAMALETISPTEARRLGPSIALKRVRKIPTEYGWHVTFQGCDLRPRPKTAPPRPAPAPRS